MSVGVFLPCRAGSERVPQKNIKVFCEFQFGLVQIKLEQLLGVEGVERIYLSTNDSTILDYASNLKQEKLIIHERREQLCHSSTSTDELVSHAADLVQEETIMWTHVTSPFINSKVYENSIIKYYEQSAKGFDSLVSVTPLQSFLWNEEGPLNYDRSKEKWPRTQTLDTIYEINSGIFLAPKKVYQQNNDRIGINPFLMQIDRLTAHDVDWPEDYELAEAIHLKKMRSL